MGDLSRFATPPELVDSARDATVNTLPASKKIYLKDYNKFISWKKSKKATSFSENVLLAYFNDLSTAYSPSTLWSKFSMLKSTLLVNDNIDIKNYSKLKAFIKKQNVGHQPKKSKILTARDVEKYLNEAPDETHLDTKVALILGITGACRREDLTKLLIDDVTEHDEAFFLVKLVDTKTNVPRSFTITDKFYSIVKKYMLLRPTNCKVNRFFLNYQKGKCVQQPIGIHKFGNMPNVIAKYLGLPDPELYTGHSFRRTSATLLVESGADITTLKRHGGWKSDRVAEGYIEDSINNKNRVCDKIGKFITLKNDSDSEVTATSKKNNPPATVNINSQLQVTENVKSNTVELHQSQSSCVINNHKELNLSSLLKFPNEKFNLTITNSNVTFNFNAK